MAKQPTPPTSESADTEEPSAPPPKKKKSLLSRLFRLLASLVFILALVLAGVAALLTHFFPGEEIRPVAEDQLSQNLKTPVSIGALSFNLLEGFQLDNVSFGGPQPFFKVKQILLDYDVSALLEGRFTIHQMLVDEPTFDLVSKNGVWNFQPLLELGGKEPKPKSPAPPPEEPAGLPLAVNLDQFSIRNISVDAKIDDQMVAHLHGLTLNAQASAAEAGIDLRINLLMKGRKGETQPNVSFLQKQNPPVNFRTRLATDLNVHARDTGQVILKGMVGLAQTFTRVGRKLPSPDIQLKFDGRAEMKAQTAQLDELDLKVGKAGRLKLTAGARNLLGNPDFSLRIPEATFDLKELTDLARQFLPPMQLSGQLGIRNLEVTGRMKNNKPDLLRVPGGGLTLQNLNLDHPGSNTALRGVEMGLNLKDIKVAGTTPQHAEMGLTLAVASGHAGDMQFKGLKQTLSLVGTGANLDHLQLAEKTDLKEFRMQHPTLGEKVFPVNLATKINASVRSGTVEILPTRLNLGPLFSTELQGSVKQFGKQGIQIQQTARFDFDQVRQWVPAEMVEKFGLGPLTGRGSLDWKLDGKLDPKRAGEWVPPAVAKQIGVRVVPAAKAKKEFPPLNGRADVHLKLDNVTTALTQPKAVSVAGLNLDLTLPVVLDARRGVQAPETKVALALDEAHAMEQYDVQGARIETTVKADRFLPLTGELGGMTGVNDLHVELDQVKGVKPDFAVAGLLLDAVTSADLHSPQDVQNIQMSGRVSSGALAAMQQIAADSFGLDFNVDAADLNLEDSHVVMKAGIQKPSFKKEGLSLAVNEVQLDTDTRQNLKTGDVAIAKARVFLPQVLSLDTKGALREWGQGFDVVTTLSQVNLANALDLVPEQYTRAIDGLDLDGRADFVLKAKGERPDEDAIKKLNIPVEVESHLKLVNVHADWPKKALKVEGLDFSTNLLLDHNDLSMSGRMTMAGVTKTDLASPVTLKPEMEFDYRMDDWSHFEIVRHRIGLSGHEIEQTLTGRVEGLRKLLTGEQEKNINQLVRTLDVALDNRVEIDLAKVAPLASGLKADGILGSTMKVNLLAGKKVDLNGEIHFRHLNVDHASGTKLTDIDGEFLLNKTLLLERTLKKEGAQPFSAARQGFFNQLREFSKYKNIFKIGAVEFGSHRATNVGMDIYYSGNRLFIDHFMMDLLGGGVAGSLFLTQTEKGPELKFNTEFAHLDFNKLLKKPVGASGRDVEIDGNMTFGFKVNQGGTDQRISMDQIATRLNITHIGKEALDRALLFLDPEESKPAIVDTRAKLKTASPEDLEVVVENGNLSMEVGLNLLGNMFAPPGLKRVPITSLKQFKEINDQLQKLKDFQNALNYLSANGIEFDDEGNVIFF